MPILVRVMSPNFRMNRAVELQLAEVTMESPTHHESLDLRIFAKTLSERVDGWGPGGYVETNHDC